MNEQNIRTDLEKSKTDIMSGCMKALTWRNKEFNYERDSERVSKPVLIKL